MNNNWPIVTVKDVCESVIDCVNKTAPVVQYETSYKMIRTTNVKKGVVNLKGARFVEKATFEKWTRRAVPRVGDVILTREAPLGDVGMITTPNENIFLGQRLMQYRVDAENLDAHYLLYALQGPKLQGQLKAAGSGSTVEHIRVGDAENLQIELPPILEQREIGKVLASYDNLIENNNRRIIILEEMAQSLYREWFVNFRYPGHADDTNNSESADENSNESEVKNSSKSPLIDSTLGPIPEGWEVKILSDVASVNPESITKKNAPESIGYIDIKSVGTGIIEEVKPMQFSDAPSRARRKVVDGDIIWATVRPNRKQYSYICKPKASTVASTGFAVLRALDIPSSYLYSFTTTDAFTSYLVNHATGSAYPAVNSDIFKKANVLIPPTDILAKFDALCSVSMLQSEVLKKKNENLKKQRDMLLPKLISGDIEL